MLSFSTDELRVVVPGTTREEEEEEEHQGRTNRRRSGRVCLFITTQNETKGERKRQRYDMKAV